MVLGRIATHGQDDIGILDVGPAVRHGAAPECGGQTGHRRAMSYTGLLFHGDDAQSRTEGFYQQIIVFVAVGTASDHAYCGKRIDGLSLGVFFDQPVIARLLQQLSDTVDSEIPGLFLPVIAAGSTITNLGQRAGR